MPLLPPRLGALGLVFSLPFLVLQGEESEESTPGMIEMEVNLDPLVTLPDAWDLTPEQLDEVFPKPDNVEKNPIFEWLTVARDRAYFTRRPFSNVEVNLTLFDGEVQVEDATVDFVDGKMNGVTFSVFNRGDSESLSGDEFAMRFKRCGQEMGARLQVRPFPRKAAPAQGLLTEGWTWISEHGMAVLEHNPDAMDGGPQEFMRLRMVRRDATGPLAAAMRSQSGAAVKLSDLPRNVTENPDGDTFIEGIPMVDQGMKGYCVVASAQRLFEYYGIPCDQHQLAQVAGTSATTGTSTIEMSEALDRIDGKFKTRFKMLGLLFVMRDGTGYKLFEPKESDLSAKRDFELDDFRDAIEDYVDDGIPLLWALELGRVPEEPAISVQAGGGHMRMIIGYNLDEDELIFSDSWGAGHEFKRMKIDDAYSVTHGVFALYPTTQ